MSVCGCVCVWSCVSVCVCVCARVRVLVAAAENGSMSHGSRMHPHAHAHAHAHTSTHLHAPTHPHTYTHTQRPRWNRLRRRRHPPKRAPPRRRRHLPRCGIICVCARVRFHGKAHAQSFGCLSMLPLWEGTCAPHPHPKETCVLYLSMRYEWNPSLPPLLSHDPNKPHCMFLQKPAAKAAPRRSSRVRKPVRRRDPSAQGRHTFAQKTKQKAEPWLSPGQ